MSRQSREQRYREAQRQRSFEAKREKVVKAAQKVTETFAAKDISFSWKDIAWDADSVRLLKHDIKVDFAKADWKFSFDTFGGPFGAASRPASTGRPINEHVSLWPFHFEIKHVVDHGVDLQIETSVRDRNFGERMPLTFWIGIDPNLDGPARTAKIREIILRAVAHELDECLRHRDGTRVTEPHDGHGAPFFPLLIRADEVPADAPERRGFLHEITGEMRHGR